MAEPKFQLAELSPEEANQVKADLDALLEKHSIQFVIAPIINQNGTLGASMNVLKKLKLVPEGSVPSPAEFLPHNGETPRETGAEA